VEHVARDGAELIVLLELFASGYFLNEHLLEFGEPAGGATEQWLCAAAKGLHVYLGAGFVERKADVFFNCWALAGPDGAVIGRTRKTFTELCRKPTRRESDMRGHMTTETRPVQIKAGAALINGDLTIPQQAVGVVVFAHGSGSSRFSRRNRAVAQTLEDGGVQPCFSTC
jgi:predicted amidohydrolase